MEKNNKFKNINFCFVSKRKSKLSSILLICFCFFSALGLAQTTIYSEDFSTNGGKGNNQGNVDVSGITNWSISTSGVTINSGEYFYVNNNRFEARGNMGQTILTGVPCYWYANMGSGIDISNYTNISLSFTLGATQTSSSSGIIAQISFDGTNYIDVDYLTSFSGSRTTTIQNLTGSTLFFRVLTWTTSSTHVVFFDNIILTGTSGKMHATISSSGTGTFVVPDNVSSLSLYAWGGGGGGGATSSNSSAGGGGGGGAVAFSSISVVPGTTCYYSVGNGGLGAQYGAQSTAGVGGDTWFSKASNAAPTLASDGVLAKGGGNGINNGSSSGGGTGGSSATSVGTLKNSGGNGGWATTYGGGGGGAAASLFGTKVLNAASALNGSNQGALTPSDVSGGKTDGLSGNGGYGEGTGSNTAGGAGSLPGGGGGGSDDVTTAGNNGGNGGVGKLIIVYRKNSYYSNNNSPNANANNLSNWNSQPDGGGVSPVNFEDADFYIQPNHKYQLSSSLNGGPSSNLNIQSGGALDLNGYSLLTWKTINLIGTGISQSGALFNSSTTASVLSIPVVLGNAATITSSGSGGLTLSASINTMGYDLIINGQFATTVTTNEVLGSGTIIKNGEGVLTLSGVGNLVLHNFTISGGKVVAEKNLTINGILNLNAVNPNETDGLLNMVINYGSYGSGSYSSDPSYDIDNPMTLTNANSALKDNTSSFNNLNSYILTLGANATVTGSGDVTGKIRRTQIQEGITYTFGNANTQLTFVSVNGSALPTQITLVSTRGSYGVHSDKPNAVKRLFQILRTGGESATRFTLRLPYEDIQLNGNTNEANLVLWDHHIPYNGITPHEHGKTSNDGTSNYIELSNHGLFYLATEGDVNFTKYWMISQQITEVPTWLGAVPGGVWETTSNWTSGIVPTASTSVIIPSATTTAYDPTLTNSITVGTIEIQENGVFSAADKVITIKGGPAVNGGRGSWNNNGTFNADTSTVVFDYTDATISGTTVFANITVTSSNKASVLANAIASVTGEIISAPSSTLKTISNGTLRVVDFTLNDTFTFENNGTLEVLGTLTDSRATKNYGGLVRYAATTGSQTVIGAAYNHLDLTAASTKLFSSDPTVAGNFTISEGSVTPPSLFVFNGNTTQNIVGLPYNNITFSGTGDKIFTSNGSISSSSAITFDSGAATIDFDGDGTQHFVLKSDSIGTARIGNVGNFNLTGKVSVERFLLNNANSRLWRLLTAPVVSGSNTTIFENWQNNGLINGVTGTDVWGPGSGYSIQNNGMYYLPISTHNFRKYINGAWTSVTNTKTEPLFTADKNNAFLTFIIYPAGSGIAPNGTGAFQGVPGAASTTLVAKGNLLSGTQNYTLNNTNYHLIGNPYASPIDFENLIASNGVNGNTITEKIWLLDPELGDFGNYVTWDPQAGYSNVNSANHIAGAKIIHSGQGFFVKGKSGATSSNFEIKESDKIASNSYIFGRTTTNNYERIRVNLDKISNGVTNHKDACVAVFYNEASNAVTEKDVQKFTNPAETLSFYNGATSLSSEHRAPIVDNDILFIRLTQATANSSYKLKINTENFTFAGSATFHDLKLGVVTLLPLDGSVFEYPFEVTSDSSTQGVRFKIVFTTTLSLEDNPNTDTITVYPNPTSKSEGITINLGTIDFGTYSYRIINPLGQEIQKGDLTNYEFNQEFKINFNTALNSGVYIFEVIENNKNLKTMKLLIE